jgi:hypothetical protein
MTVTFFILLMFLSTACAPVRATRLAEFTENDVHVSIRLEKTEAGAYLLSATFTPPDGFHLYSKDIPRDGVDGLGRPTLLELPAESTPSCGQCREMQANGELEESIAAEIPPLEPKELRIYPEGPVTLRLPVNLPETTERFEDAVSVTFMACRDTVCKPPIVGKIITVKINPNFSDR